VYKFEDKFSFPPRAPEPPCSRSCTFSKLLTRKDSSNYPLATVQYNVVLSDSSPSRPLQGFYPHSSNTFPIRENIQKGKSAAAVCFALGVGRNI